MCLVAILLGVLSIRCKPNYPPRNSKRSWKMDATGRWSFPFEMVPFFRETCQFSGEPYRSYSKPWGGGSFNLLTIWSLILNPSNITWATQDTHPCDIPWNPEWFNRDPYNYGLLKSPCKLVVPIPNNNGSLPTWSQGISGPEGRKAHGRSTLRSPQRSEA